MEVVDFVHRGEVDEPVHGGDVEEVPCHIEHHAPVAEPGAVGDPDPRQHDRAAGRRELPQCLHAPEQTGRATRPDGHTVGGDLQRVLLVVPGRFDQQRDALRRPFLARLGRRTADQLGQVVPHPFGLWVGRGDDLRAGGDREPDVFGGDRRHRRGQHVRDRGRALHPLGPGPQLTTHRAGQACHRRHGRQDPPPQHETEG
jgi:hypothetical protein